MGLAPLPEMPDSDSSFNSSNANFTSTICCALRAGSLRRQREISFSSSCGICGIGGGSSRITAVRVACLLAPVNARRPLSISYSTAPKAKMSVAAFAGLPSACSGDI